MQNLILNRYKILQKAGSGGFATVYVAWDTRIQRRVAIKCLEFEGSQVDEDTIPGLTEARTAALLSDPSIVGVIDFEIEWPMAYLIMEYVDGISLTQLMHDAGGPLALDIVTAVFQSVSHALEVAHDNQVLHLDIKPDNVLINRQGKVKVTDFGLAELSHNAGFGSATGGTIGYMPLEQMRLEAPDERTDEWALAALTYEMLTGDNPFRARDLSAAERAIEDAEVVIPSLVRGDVDEWVDDAIFKALAIGREDRYPSVQRFADALLPRLGNAAKGERELAIIVGEACADEEDVDGTEEMEEVAEQAPRRSRRTRSPHGRAVADHLWSLVSCGFVSVLACFNIPQLTVGDPLWWGVLIALVALAGLVPFVGCLTAMLALSAAIVLKGNVVMGLVLGALSVLWYVLCGRKGSLPAAVGPTAALLGAVGLGPVSPLLCGWALSWKNATISSLLAAGIAFVLACAGSLSMIGWDAFSHFTLPSMMDNATVAMAQNLGTWITAASWVIAGLVAGAGCSSSRRALPSVAMAAATVIVAAGLAWASYLNTGGVTALSNAVGFAATIAIGVLLSILAGIYTPEREERVTRSQKRAAKQGADSNADGDAYGDWDA